MQLSAGVLAYLLCTPMILIPPEQQQKNTTTVASLVFIDAGITILKTEDTLDMSCKIVTTGLR